MTKDVQLEPRPLNEEIEFILHTAGTYLEKVPAKKDILSMFAGIRPLVKSGDAKNTVAMSRDHTIHISKSGLLTIAGGKWTTYRQMAKECVDHAVALADLAMVPCGTEELNIHGYHKRPERYGEFAIYGADAPAVEELIRTDPGRGERLHPKLSTRAGEVLWAVRFEAARTVDDFLARRTRCLLLNARAARESAPTVASLMAAELGRDQHWVQEQIKEFEKISEIYLPP